VVAVPLLIGALILSLRGSSRAQLVWLGMLDYVLYNYAYCLFGTAFNRFFLSYAALFTLSMLVIIFALVKVDVGSIRGRFGDRTPVRSISGYLLFVAAGIGGLWIAQSLSFVFTEQVADFISKVDHPTSVVFALDLSLVVPFLILGAIWLWEAPALGLLAGCDTERQRHRVHAGSRRTIDGGNDSRFSEHLGRATLWGLLSLGFLAASLSLLANVQPTEEQEDGVISHRRTFNA
jgi:hypothetical protein